MSNTSTVSFYTEQRSLVAAPAHFHTPKSTAIEAIWGALQKRWKNGSLGLLVQFFSNELTSHLGYVPTVSQDTLTCPIEDLPTIYQREKGPVETSRNGIVYTPASLTAALCEEFITDQQQRILDPSCGSGAFLLAAANTLLKKPHVTASESGVLIASKLFGIDRDKSALLITRMLLATVLCEHTTSELHPKILTILSKQIVYGDTLLPELDHPKEHWSRTEGSFDLIIGNPPYGLSRNNQLSHVENSTLKEKYRLYRNGRVNKYLLFIARSYQLAKQHGGQFCLIVPNSWLGIKEAQTIRNLLLREGGLEEIRFLTKETFKEVGVETVVITGRARSELQLLTLRHSHRTYVIPREQCRALPGQVIPTFWSPETGTLIEKLLACPHRLGDTHSPLIPRIALQAYAINKGVPLQTKEEASNRSFHTTVKENEMCIPYLEGKDITPFRISWSGEYLKYGKWLAEPQSLSRFTGPRILVREIIQRPPRLLIATYTGETYLYNKSILHIIPKENCSEVLVWGIAALLQSTLISTWLRILGKKTQRTLFPKIVLGDLKGIPIPTWDQGRYEELCTLSRLAHYDKSPEILAKIDRAVLTLYNIPYDDLLSASE